MSGELPRNAPPGAAWDGTQWVAYDGRVWNGQAWVSPPPGAGPQIARPWDAPPPAPKKPKKNVSPWWVIGILAVVAVVVIGLYSASGGSKSTPTGPDNGDRYGAFVVCQDQVSDQLKAPSTAEFASITDSSVSNSGDVWTVTSYVDAQNGFGAQIRVRWTCTATHISGDRYNVRATLDE